MSSSIDFRQKLDTALNVASITDLLDLDANGEPALFQGVVIPEDCEGYKTINYYQIAPINAANVVQIGRFSVDCRALTEGEAFTIALAVTEAVNMVSRGTFYTTISIGQTIPPADKTDVFNIPLELVMKQR